MDFDFSIPDFRPNGYLKGNDLRFFYYDIGLENLQGNPIGYEWETILEDFHNQFGLDIQICRKSVIPTIINLNAIRLTIGDKESESEAFFRHLRNAFSHYRVARVNDEYHIKDIDKQYDVTMIGRVKVDVLQQFCFRLHENYQQKIEQFYNEQYRDTIIK